MGKSQLLKRAAAAVLAAAVMLPVSALAAFSDTSGNEAESAINKWSGQYGIIQGYPDGTFRPNNTITRGAFAAILTRFLQYRTAADAGTFSDVAGTWCEEYVLKLNAAGVYQGNSGKALITADITRQQAVTMIARAFGIQTSDTALTYDDSADVASYAAGYVSSMAAKGYLAGIRYNYFRPTDPITRAEVVEILDKMVNELYQTSGTYTANVDGTLMINASDGATLSGMKVGGDLIIAPGVTGTVTLKDCTVSGTVNNMGAGTVETVTTPVVTPTDPVVTPTDPNQEYITYSGMKTPVLTDVQKNLLSSGDFSWNEQGRLVCNSSQFTTRFGIDVAAYQNRNCPDNTIDWNAVKADGVDFAMIRVALRGTSSGTLAKDAFYQRNLDGAIAAGIETGAYIFSQATTVDEAVEEADYVISLINGRQITGPIAYDWEMKDSTYRVYGTSREVANACALAFCQRIQEAGYQPMIYVSKYVGYFKFNLSDLKAYPIWYPEYKYSGSSSLYPSFYYQVNYWQYNDKSTISGIGGKVDVNLQLIRNS